MGSIRSAACLGTCIAFAGVAAHAAEQRTCRFERAVFADGGMESVQLGVTIAANQSAARIRVDRSGEYSAKRTRSAVGADDLVFDTGAARESMTIGPNGNALWLIDYRDPGAAAQGYVTSYVGMCRPWAEQ